MGRVLDHRVYRAAFVPALVALFVVAFSLGDRPAPRTTRLAPDAFDAQRAFGSGAQPQRDSLLELAKAFPDRRPGSPGDLGLADRAAQWFVSTGFTRDVRRVSFEARTIAGTTELTDVLARRVGLSSRTVVVLAHRDAASGPAVAQLSGTAGLFELARVLADRDLRKTVVLASVSGGSGGAAGAQRVLQEVPGPVDAVLVLGDLASVHVRRPFVVPWGNGGGVAPEALRRTVESALRRETAMNPGHDRGAAQWLRRAFPLSVGEQGPLVADGAPAVLVSASAERGPSPHAAVSADRLGAFGRGVLRAFTAAEDSGSLESGTATTPAFPGGDGIVTLGRLVPAWAIRLLVLTLLLPVLLAAVDAFFRVRRRGLPMARWLGWSTSFALPLLLAYGWVRVLGLTGAVRAVATPTIGGALALHTAGWLALASIALVLLVGARLVRRPLLRAAGVRGEVGAGGAAAATGLALAVLVAIVWVANPYAAFLLLPAAHLWLLASAPERRVGRLAAVAVAAAGLVGPALVVLYYAHVWGLGAGGVVWTAFGAVCGGSIGLGAALALSAFGGALCATIAVLAAKARAAAGAPPDAVVTRGPRSYAGPGSLGGTESALRR
jgi:hypothetical protein